MNEHIQELAEHATEQATTRHPVSNIALVVNPDVFKQKFAELIVHQCMKIADMPLSADGKYDDLLPSQMIAKHFGIK